MAKVIFKMTDGVPHGADYVAPTGVTPVGLGVVEVNHIFQLMTPTQLLQLMVQMTRYMV